MRLEPLGSYRRELVLGKPLPFGIFDAEGRLLLAEDHAIDSEAQLDELLQRGAYIEANERSRAIAKRMSRARARDVPGMWARRIDDIGHLLRASVERGELSQALELAAEPVLALIERDPDLAIFQLVQQAETAVGEYSSRHAVHAGIAVFLTARRLGWAEPRVQTAFRAALTMNVSMVELQNKLAIQMSPPTTKQRDEIRTHPERSVEILRRSGVGDAEWLEAVAQHHEYGDGHGYPSGRRDAGEMAQLLQRADVFTAKLSTRAQRRPLSADEAARGLYLRDSGHPISAAMIKEFGIYPPGCAVRLQSGELGIAVRRGEAANLPIVIVVADVDGNALAGPQLRMTSQRGFGVAEVLPQASLRMPVPLDELLALAE